jgi:hypothetical protein
MTAIAVSVTIAAALSKNMRKRFRRYGTREIRKTAGCHRRGIQFNFRV